MGFSNERTAVDSEQRKLSNQLLKNIIQVLKLTNEMLYSFLFVKNHRKITSWRSFHERMHRFFSPVFGGGVFCKSPLQIDYFFISYSSSYIEPRWWNGRHEGLKILCRKVWEFESLSRHQARNRTHSYYGVRVRLRLLSKTPTLAAPNIAQANS